MNSFMGLQTSRMHMNYVRGALLREYQINNIMNITMELTSSNVNLGFTVFSHGIYVKGVYHKVLGSASIM